MTLLLVKVILVATVLTTALTACYIDRSIPYFPIEISRLATGLHSRWVFLAGTILAFVASGFSSWNDDPCLLFALTGLVVLAVFDDRAHWGLHMIGVIMIMFAVIGKWFLCREGGGLLLVALGLYVSRIVIKTVAVMMYESKTGGLYEVFDISLKIMYSGHVQEQVTLNVFRFAAACQWVVFLLLGSLF